MGVEPLSNVDRSILLKLARVSIEHVSIGKPLPELDLSIYSNPLQENGASFVTLTKSGALRGCIGALEAYQPLVQDVCEHAAAAAMADYRFTPVSPAEVPYLRIEISRLTQPVSKPYTRPMEILDLIEPHADGVILRYGGRRATFLPQVWEKLPDPEDFLNHLCQKMGLFGDIWKEEVMELLTYRVEEFSEE